MIQQSPEWYAARCGKVTASRISDVLAGGKGVSREAYKLDLVAERLTGLVASSFSSPEMAWGTEQEQFARAAFELHSGQLVEEVGFVPHPRLEAGASPDGLVGEHAVLEIKCPKTSTHIAYMEAGVVPSKYMPQIQWQLACTGRSMAYFASYDVRMPADSRLFVAETKRDDIFISRAESAVSLLLVEVAEIVKRLGGPLAEIKRDLGVALELKRICDDDPFARTSETI